MNNLDLAKVLNIYSPYYPNNSNKAKVINPKTICPLSIDGENLTEIVTYSNTHVKDKHYLLDHTNIINNLFAPDIHSMFTENFINSQHLKSIKLNLKF